MRVLGCSFISIMDVFDDLPHFLKEPPTECVFVSMVRTLLNAPDSKMKFAQFGRRFTGAKMVFLMPFFEIIPGSAAEIQLRYHDFDNAMDCAKFHWESRLDLTCRKGQ